MGLSGSKVKYNVSLQEESVPSASTVTPKNIRNHQDLDPRSPSMNIVRTPLELLSMDDVEESAQVTGTPLKSYKVLDVDPRSPAIEFNRTPIVVNVNKTQPEKLKNKNLDRVLTSASPSPRLVGSRLLTKRPETTHKRMSFTGLLETNIDFTETDLDVAAKERNKYSEVVGELKIEDAVEELKVQDAVTELDKNCDVCEPCTSTDTDPIVEEYTSLSPGLTDLTPESIPENDVALSHGATGPVPEDCIPLSHGVINPTTEDYILTCSSLSQGATNAASDPILQDHAPFSHGAMVLSSDPITTDVISDSNNDLIPNIAASQAIVNPIPDKSCPLPIVFDPIPDVVPTLSDHHLPSSPVTPPDNRLSEIDLSADIKEFDRKLTNLIYEDRDLIVCPKIVELKDVMERSPLRNLNLSEKKSAQKLRVSNKPRKSDYAVSKIPVFKDRGKLGVQCENTPPAYLENGRAIAGRKTRWDNADATLYL